MFEGPVQAATVVSIRELVRSASRLIDRVERDGEIIALGRYGRMVAVLAPVPERMTVDFEGSRRTTAPDDDGGPEEVDLPDWLEQDEIPRRILREALRAHPMPFSPNDFRVPIDRVWVALTRLELANFVERTLRGNRLTPRGVAAARTLEARLDKENGSPPS